MDSSILVIALIIFIVIAVVKALFHSPETKGQLGEDEVARIIYRASRKGFYGKLLQNVYIPKANGGTTEIDILFVSVKGIVVFEVKNYAGYIFGSSDRKEWTVTLYAGKTWYGSNILFGPQTVYAKDDQEYEFDSSSYWTLKLGVQNGNISSDPIDSFEFPE